MLQVASSFECNMQFAICPNCLCARCRLSSAACRLCGIIITIRLQILVACCMNRRRQWCHTIAGHVAGWLCFCGIDRCQSQVAGTETARHRRRRRHKLWLSWPGACTVRKSWKGTKYKSIICLRRQWRETEVIIQDK